MTTTTTLYEFSLFHEPDAPSALRRLLTFVNDRRFCERFNNAEEFRTFRDGLSACGICLMEIEKWTEETRETVL